MSYKDDEWRIQKKSVVYALKTTDAVPIRGS